MEGVILFADDNIFDDGFENELFKKFNLSDEFSVLPINNLTSLENTIPSISTFRALIVDWNFKRPIIEGEEALKLPDENPLELLLNSKLFSLIYVYSQEDISGENKNQLLTLYPGRIFFEKKDKVVENIDKEFEKIANGIKKFESENSHLEVPFVWSQVINSCSQHIFTEFENADKFWIKELYYSSVRKCDSNGLPILVEMEPTVEVINLFQNILSERLIQDNLLKQSIQEYSHKHHSQNSEPLELAKLYTKLYYTPTPITDTIMTGDIYKFDEDCFGILISPECDISRLVKKNEYLEFLCFSVNSFDKINDFCQDKDLAKKEEKIIRSYNQENPAIHLLPIFEFSSGNRKTALIDFRFNLKLIKGKYLDDNKQNRKVKLNTPYIQQLRQRYLSYIGRVGVPAIPNSLRFTN